MEDNFKKTCLNCGSELNENDKFCVNCGTKVESIDITYESPQAPKYQPVQNKTTNGYVGVSIAALVCSIASVVFFCSVFLSVVLAITGLVLGIISLVKKYDGKGMAIAGVITSSIMIVLLILFLIIFVVYAVSLPGIY